MKKILILIISVFMLFSCNKEEIKIRTDKIEKMSTKGFNPLNEKSIKNKISEKQKQENIWNNIHIKTPKKVEALYYSYSGILDNNKFNILLKIAKNTSINSVIIDVKEVDGIVHLDEKVKTILNKLQSEKIYKIARIVVFKDNLLTKKRPDLAYKWTWNKKKIWKDYALNTYLDAGSKEVWDYNLDIASQAYKMGFDEINFDYIRFPSDGKINKIYAPFSDEILKKDKINGKIKIINNFSKYITTQLRKKYPKIILSADVFGLVTNGDLHTIGQSLEGFLQNFDYVAPMTYPSHYGNGFLGFKYPDNHPYEVLTDALKHSYNKIEKYNKKLKKEITNNNSSIIPFHKGDKQSPLQKSQIRLWLQGFSCTWCKGSTPYYDNKFKKQTKAIVDNNSSGFAVWNANSNYYESWYK